MFDFKSCLKTAKAAALVIAGGLFLASCGDSDNGTGSISGDQKTAIEKIVHQYLVNNPQILIEMEQKFREDQAKKQAAAQQKAIVDNAETIFRSKTSFVAGNPKGKVTVVEFFDYNCGFCQRAFRDIQRLLKSDKDVRFVFKEMPVLGPPSVDAARAAIAAKKQGKYFEMHRALFETPGPNTKEKALRVAKDLGLDVEKLKKDMQSKDVEKEIQEVLELANKLGIQGTPHFLIGRKVIQGAPQDLLQQLKTKLAEVRKQGCKIC